MSGLVEHILRLPSWIALLVVFAMPALEASTFLGFIFPGEIACLLGGVLAFESKVSLALVIVVAVAGAVIGDSVGFRDWLPVRRRAAQQGSGAHHQAGERGPHERTDRATWWSCGLCRPLHGSVARAGAGLRRRLKDAVPNISDLEFRGWHPVGDCSRRCGLPRWQVVAPGRVRHQHHRLVRARRGRCHRDRLVCASASSESLTASSRRPNRRRTAPKRLSCLGRRLARGRAHQVRDDVEFRDHDPLSRRSWHPQTLVGKALELGVAGIEREYGGADPACIGHPFEQLFRCGVRRDDENRLASSDLFQSLQPDCQMRRRVGRRRPPHQHRREPWQIRPARFVVEMRGEVPRLLCRGADQQQSARPRAVRGATPDRTIGCVRPIRYPPAGRA